MHDFGLEGNQLECIKAADGRSLQHYGQRQVEAWSYDEYGNSVNLTMNFRVLNVRKPLFSVSKLVHPGCLVTFDDEGGWISRNGHRIRFNKIGDMFGVRLYVDQNVLGGELRQAVR